MANEILYAGVADQRTAEALTADYLMLAADRNSLPNHPALHYAGDTAGIGSNTLKVPHTNLLGGDLPQSVADGAAVPNTAWTTGATTVTTGRYAKSYGPSDMARFTDSLGLLAGPTLAQDAFASAQLSLTSSIAGLMGGFSNTVGASGVNLSIANVLAALTLLEVGYQGGIMPGGAMGVIHTVQGGDLRTALATATGGALQWNVPAEQLVLRGTGFRGRYLDVDWFVSGYVPMSGVNDRGGAIFVQGGVVWGDMSVSAEGTEQLAIGGKVLFERDRNAPSGITQFVSANFHGVSEGIDTFGVSIITDA